MQYCIILPCYNEGSRILISEFLSFVEANPNYNLLFVDDGSKDNTVEVLESLSEKSPSIHLLKLPKNQGKAEAVRAGMKEALKSNKYTHFGYLDADLAIPFSEVLRLAGHAGTENSFVFSSKKPSKESELEMQFKRIAIGRVLSIMVRLSLGIPIYDTQCGCKLMHKHIAEIAFQDKFISSWLFDIEIIWRIIVAEGKKSFKNNSMEVPLIKLIDRGSSRIKIKDLFSLPFEFFKIHSHYTKQLKAK